ncbi:MAG: 2-isopropylmalate synthase, partial [Desulfatitalea sp.]|nr:2-isopropylmalate synthase [Desulfatitalea sp.]
MSSNNVFIFDTTLRDGEQSPGASMNTAEKLRLAIQLERLGVDALEAGFPAASEGDFEAVSEIAAKLRHTEVVGLARANKQDIDAAWGAIKSAAKPRIHTFIATSDIHLEYKLKMTREQVLNDIQTAVSYAKSMTDNVEFSAEDGSRSDRDFLCRAFEIAIAAGATTVNLPDTVGYAVPSEFADLVRYVMDHTPNIHQAVVSIHCHNDLGLATANTLAALAAGARQAEVTLNGIGERAGNTSLEEVVMALHTRNNYLPFTTQIKTEQIHPCSRLVSMITGILVQPNKAIVGANAFAHEAGIHQDGILKNPMTYEIMRPETIGLSTTKLVLGKHSGRHALREHLKDMGYELSDDELKIIFTKFKALADRKKHVMDEDLEALVTEGVLRTAEIFKLEYLQVTAGTTVIPMATVQLTINGRSVKGAGFGNGPIDAAYNAIATLTGTESELLRFTVSALTVGT